MPAMTAWSGASSVFLIGRLLLLLLRLRLVGRRWSRCDILDFSNSLLAPLGGITLEWLVSDIQPSQIGM